MTEVVETKTRKAKKEHNCSYCGLKIEVGESYKDAALVYDGELYHWKSHLSCEDLTKKLDMFKDCFGEGLTVDDFREYVTEFLYRKGIKLLKWEDRIAKAKEILLKEGA